MECQIQLLILGTQIILEHVSLHLEGNPMILKYKIHLHLEVILLAITKKVVKKLGIVKKLKKKNNKIKKLAKYFNYYFSIFNYFNIIKRKNGIL